jgi:nucleoid-associated protein YgaU
MFALTGILFLAGISLTAFVLRLTEPETRKTVPGAAYVNANPVASPVETPTPAAVVPAAPAPAKESTARNYNADPEESGATQIMTVAAMPGQTIEDISRSYAGRFDAELFQQIRELNPEIKDPDHLSAGQLIRLPLPRGSFRKGKDLTSEK